MLYPFKGIMPTVSDDAFVAPGARVIGQVTLHSGSSVWYNAVLRGDVATIEIGEGSNVQDMTVIHVDSGASGLAHPAGSVTVGFGKRVCCQ